VERICVSFVRRLVLPSRLTAMKRRIVTLGFGAGRQKMILEDGRIPNSRGVRVALSTGYKSVEGSRRASRNGPVSDLPPETPNVTIRNCFIAVRLCVKLKHADAPDGDRRRRRRRRL
jgi:hypothetical protein